VAGGPEEDALRIRIDWCRCRGHGVCAELLGEVIVPDEWGYPLVRGPVPPELAGTARRAVSFCPALALSLVRGPVPR